MKQYFSRYGAKIAAGIAVLTAGWLTFAGVTTQTTTKPPKVTVSSEPINRTGTFANSFAPVVKRVAPSVVNIYSTRTLKIQRFGYPFGDDPLFRYFFGEPRRGQPEDFQQRGLGSGVIVSEDGYILTNHHVVEGADKDGVKVALADGKQTYVAEVIGTDPQTDIAVLKINAKNLDPIVLGDSDQVQVGDVVLAVGNPFGVGQSVTMGIVSALGRDVGGQILGRAGYEDFIQTDAPINPGNSGGALVDVNGRLIGINQSIVSGTGANAGIGFAIPINMARSIMDRLVTEGKITRGYLGVNIQSLTLDLAKEFDLSDDAGALVTEVQSDTPAERAGIKVGDIIVEFNGKKVNDSHHLRIMVGQTAPDTKVTLKLVRDGKNKNVSVTLGTLPEEFTSNDDRGSFRSERDSDELKGAEVADLDARTRRQFGIPQNIEGAVVTRVQPGSGEAEAGLKPGDVILEIDRQPVRSAQDAVELSNKSKDKRTLLRVWSNANGVSGTRYVIVNEPDKE